MAEKPIKTPLPADLPEDWNVGQIVAPDGTTVGLTEQHGYNYLMAAVNRAQRGVNEVNNAFETISAEGARRVVGTSAGGWTKADCDYLCDGTDDQIEIQKALDAVGPGGEVVLLPGQYNLSGYISVFNAWLHGLFTDTQPLIGARIVRDTADGYGDIKSIICIQSGKLSNIRFSSNANVGDTSFDISISSWGHIENVQFVGTQKKSIYISGRLSDYTATKIRNCYWGTIDTAIYADSSGGSLLVEHNDFLLATKFIDIHGGSRLNVSIIRNGTNSATFGGYYLDNLARDGGHLIQGNIIGKLSIEHTDGSKIVNAGSLISGNVLWGAGDGGVAVVVLGENTSGWFVTGNVLFEVDESVDYYIQDLGTGNVVRFNSDDTSTGGTPATVQQATPTITANADGTITARATQAAGYVAAGTKSATYQLSSADDPDLTPDNIKEGVSIFGVAGTLQSGGVENAVTSTAVRDIQTLTQAEYDALTVNSPTTLYLIGE